MDKTDKEWIQELMNKFQQSEITKIKIRCGEIELEMEKEASRGKESSGITPETDTDGQEERQNPAEEEILSPLVGTFYAAPSPDEEPFVKEGAEITADTVVGMVESMKVFTEIPSGVQGSVQKILVHDGDFVEYDQPLFTVRTEQP